MRFIFGALLLLFSMSSFSQEEYYNHLNSTLDDILLTQVSNDLEYHIPLFWATSLGYVYLNMTFYNDKIYFLESEGDNDLSGSGNEILTSALNENLKISKMSNDKLNSSLIIKSFNEDRLLINLSYKVEHDLEIVEYAVPGKKFSKLLKYHKGKLVSTVTKKQGAYSLNNISYQGDSLVNYLNFGTKDRKYQLRTEKYSEGKIQSIDYFKKTQVKDKRKLKKRELFVYNPDGKLQKTYSVNRKGIIRDSTIFLTKKDVKRVIHYNQYGIKQMTYRYSNKQLVQKEIETKDQKITIDYGFDQSNRLVSLKFVNTGIYLGKHYLFQYNKAGELINLEIYNIDKYTSNDTLESQYVFSYNDLGLVQIIRGMDKNGKIVKEIEYDLQSL